MVIIPTFYRLINSDQVNLPDVDAGGSSRLQKKNPRPIIC